MPSQDSRLHVVDALRGFAILAIMLLHNIEHFDFYYKPEGLPLWLKTLDKGIWDSLFFLFGGKAYAIFAMLFGLTFSIQLANQEIRGRDFRVRFAWRLFLLFGFGIINSAFYQGDILMLYAMLGFVLIPVARLRSGLVFALAIVLLLQPMAWVQLWQGLQEPGMKMSDPVSWSYFGKSAQYLGKGSLVDTWIGNLTNGRKAVLLWNWEQGRVFQTCALFMLGMLAGRLGLFSSFDLKRRLWRRLLILAASCFAALFAFTLWVPGWISSAAIRLPLLLIASSLANMAFMLVLVAGFVMVYHSSRRHRVLSWLEPMGRMSLSSYVFQSLVGTSLYYGFGLGLYRHTGATQCLLIGAALAMAQLLFSRWWLSRHKQGPLEWLWHKATWIGA